MGDLVEILTISDLNGSQYTCSAWDPRTGTNLMSYKGGNAAHSNCLSYITHKFIISANSTKPLLHIWPVNSQEQVPGLRFVMPGKVNALAISPAGNFLAAAIKESVYVWQISSGKMLCFISKHYQPINVIKFTNDGSHIVTAGQDGCILVFNFTRMIDQSETTHEPLYSFNDHALAVTDIHIGNGGIRALLCSVSLDRTCRLCDLATGKTLLNLVFEEPLTCVVVDIIEANAYVGTSTGSIYTFSIVSAPRTKEYHLTAEDYTNKFLGHNGKAVTCLSLSFDGKILASGGKNDNVYLWDIASRQLLRTFPHKSSITNLKFSLSSKTMFNPEQHYNLIASNPKRMTDKLNKDHFVEVMVSNNFKIDEDSIAESLQNNIQKAQENVDTSVELKKLKEEIRKLQIINKELFLQSVQQIFEE